MKKIRRSPVLTSILFILAVVLLFAGTVGGTQAALNAPSEDYVSAFNMNHIGITLNENGADVSFRDYGSTADSGFTDESLSHGFLKFGVGDPDFLLGKTYPMALQVKNTGEIPTYIRLIIRKYWAKPSGESFNPYSVTKVTDGSYNIEFIQLGKTDTESSNSGKWVEDTTARSDESEVYYYSDIVPSLGTVDFTEYNNLRISPDVVKYYTVDQNGKYVYAYDGLGFVIEVEVDSVQTHNAIDAIISAWGQTAGDIMTSLGVSND